MVDSVMNVEPRPIFDRNNPGENFYDFKGFDINPLVSPELQEQARLAKLNEEMQKIQTYKAQSSSIFHKSIQEIFGNIADAFLGIIEDLFYPPVETGIGGVNIGDHIYIAFTRNNRLIYIGILLVLVSIYAITIQTYLQK
jgi:hypothetical protein